MNDNELANNTPEGICRSAALHGKTLSVSVGHK
jgi:hypothetical protein